MRRGRLRISLVGVAALCAGVCSSSAAAVPFGLPLGTAPVNVAPSYGGDCTTYPLLVFTSYQFAPLGGNGSCIWIHVPTPSDDQFFGGRNVSLEPPGTGTVTSVSVSVGAVTGPMQVVVMRALYQNTTTPGRPNDACCFPVARSQVFTPSANQISTFTVNLPVKEDPTPAADDITTIADFDTIGLAVLRPGVPIPLYYSSNPSDPADFVWNTSTPSTVTPGFSADTGGFFVAMSGEWASGGGAPTFDRVDHVRGGNANIGMRCATAADCIGQLLLQSGPAAGGAAAVTAKKLTTYGRASFTIKAHGHKTIAVRLLAGAKKLLKHHRTATVWANVTLSTGARDAIKITLKR